MNLSAVLDFLAVAGNFDLELQNIRRDNRQVEPGDLFIAVRGLKTDGRDFIDAAIARGAVAVLTQEPYECDSLVPIITVPNLKDQLPALSAAFYNYPAQHLKTIGITGTNGKTSTSHYIAQILNSAGLTCGVMGTIGNGLLGKLNPTQLTTSDCCTVQQQFAAVKDLGAQFVAMEVSSHALAQQRLLGIDFDTAVFTNLSQDHLDYHANMQDYFAAKALLFTEYDIKNAVINIDDPWSAKLIALLPSNTNLITYSLFDNTAAVYLSADQIHTPWGNASFTTRLLGDFNKSNVLATIAVCCLQNISLDTVLSAVKNLQPVAGRMQVVEHNDPNAPKVVVDYAHTPDAVSKALKALRDYTNGTLYCIIGCGGDRDRSKRPLMLQAALENSDQVIISQDNPRTEDPQQIVQDMLHGNTSQKIHIELDRAKAIQFAIARADKQDLILIAGKGHEDYQIIGTQKLPFSDILEAQQALVKRSENAWVV